MLLAHTYRQKPMITILVRIFFTNLWLVTINILQLKVEDMKYNFFLLAT